MFAAALPQGRLEVLERLVQLKGLQNFYLAGGTAVALHLGHRISEDFDFFTPQDFDALLLRNELYKTGEFIVTGIENHTLHGIFNGVKVSFLCTRHFLFLRNQLPWLPYRRFAGSGANQT